MTRLAVVGDIHRAWDAFDVDWFNRESGYAGVLFVGDLPRLAHRKAVVVARALAGLALPAWLVPGNHDATSVSSMFAEIAGRPMEGADVGRAQIQKVESLRAALGPITLGGYSHHSLSLASGPVGLIVARPHAMGATLSFPAYLRERFAVTTMEDSAARLCAVIDECPHEQLIFLAHNGPTGLGDRQMDIWGCDFRASGGDCGDPDLAVAVAHARAAGRRVLAVVAGHMHLQTKQGAQRVWRLERDGVVYANAARVPRIFSDQGRRWHHHLLLDLAGGACVATQRLVATDGTIVDLPAVDPPAVDLPGVDLSP